MLARQKDPPVSVSVRLAGREPPGPGYVGGTGWLLDAQVQRVGPTVWKDLMGPLLMAPNIMGGTPVTVLIPGSAPRMFPLEPDPPLTLGAALGL